MPLKKEKDKKLTYKLKNAWKEKKLGWIANLLDSKMIGWLIDAKNVKNHTQS